MPERQQTLSEAVWVKVFLELWAGLDKLSQQFEEAKLWFDSSQTGEPYKLTGRLALREASTLCG